jgi:acyl-Coa thioesterase superfamily protein/acyl-CoA thioesterase superfamily protein
VPETDLPAAFYERLDADTFAATTATMSPWDERLQHGGPPTALLARAVTEAHPRDDVRIARVASEFLGPIPIATLRVRVRMLRPGRRIELIEATMESGGRDIVSTRFWRIATQPAGSVPPGVTAADPVPAIPAEQPSPAWLKRFGYGLAVEWRSVRGGTGEPGPAAVWMRPRVPLIAGEPRRTIDAALIVADAANGISGELPMREWMFVPPSLSVALERYPRDEWILLDARTTLTDDGLGVTSSRLADTTGWFAVGSQPLLVERQS